MRCSGKLPVLSEDISLDAVSVLLLSIKKGLCKNRVRGSFNVLLLVPKETEVFPVVVFFYMQKHFKADKILSDVPRP